MADSLAATGAWDHSPKVLQQAGSSPLVPAQVAQALFTSSAWYLGRARKKIQER